MNQASVVILSAARTPIGGFQGELSPLSGAELGGPRPFPDSGRSGAITQVGGTPRTSGRGHYSYTRLRLGSGSGRLRNELELLQQIEKVAAR